MKRGNKYNQAVFALFNYVLTLQFICFATTIVDYTKARNIESVRNGK